ncbi:MAG: multidrug effflux MFS transporter [Burkholderiaceae bacterium]|nr:multidrug effflux MFS transporter [Burkholderiaceae bacterium]
MTSTHSSHTPVMSALKITLIGALLVSVGPISMSLYTPAMPEIVLAFGTTEALVKMTLTLYFAGFAFTQLICGPLSDGLGRRPVTIAFMSIYLLACIIAVFAPNIEVLLGARFLQGVGSAVGVAISRAMVRDSFSGERSFRIMNLMGMLLAVAPAISPAIGGLTLEFSHWRVLFVLMMLMGVTTVWVSVFYLRETTTPDFSRLKPLALLASYRTLLSSPHFMLTSLVVAGSVGAIYTLATVLPFILMDVVGLSPMAFGVGMVLQAGTYILGAVAVQALLRRVNAHRLVPVGLMFIGVACGMLLLLMGFWEATFLKVMIPIAMYSFGVAFVMPAMLTASMTPFPHIAGAASAMTGFLQMGAGLLGSALAALFTDPVLALMIMIPSMATTAIVSWLLWNRLPPVTAKSAMPK